jgi:two-component system sensor histidine kinase CpxA
MRSMFLKIFLWFWVTGVLVGFAAIVTLNLQPEIVVRRWRAAMGEAVSMYAQSSAEEYDRYGKGALENYLQRLGASAHIHGSLLDESGNSIFGMVPPPATRLMQQTLQSGQPAFSIHGDRALAAMKAIGPSGRTYVFIAFMPRGPIGALGVSVQAFRWAVSFLVSGLICYLLTLYLTRPVLRLRTTARQLAAGNLSARAPAKMERRRDEIGELVRDFNLMAERIETLVNGQRQLLSDISHELRSPLARLNVALGLARQRAGAAAAAPLDRIELEAERLNELIGRLLSLARMQAASEPPEKTRVNLQELLSDVAEDAGFEAQERNCTVHLNAPEDAGSCDVMGSPELLRSALENVVRNAIRYAEPGSEVGITMTCSGGKAVVAVRDHGPGVPESELQNLFRPFYRVADARERQTGGTGLGLAITERAVSLHGGTIRAMNAPDGGLIVEASLPLAAPSSATAAIPVSVG